MRAGHHHAERAVVERAPQVEQEYRFLLQDGYRWLYGVTRLVYDDDGALADTLATPRRQPSASTPTTPREREATLQAVINASPDIITILDADGAIRSMSPAAQRILGAAEIRRATAPRLGVRASRRPRSGSRTPSVSCLQRGAESARSVRVRYVEGHWLPFEAHSFALAAPEGPLIVSATSPSRPSWRRTCARPKPPPSRPTKAKSELVAHELPSCGRRLTPILGFAAQLLTWTTWTPSSATTRPHHVGGAAPAQPHQRGARHRRHRGGRLPLSLEPVALADVAAETVSLIRPLADQHQIVLVGPNVACTTHVLGDRQRLKQVLLNLLSNAVKYNREGGSVHLACEPVPGRAAPHQGHRHRARHQPRGPERLFVPFERVASQLSAIEAHRARPPAVQAPG